MEFRWRKWDGRSHWEHDCVFLGSDEWGDWVGQLAGWRSERPGRVMTPYAANVTLIPPSGEYAFTRNTDAHHIPTYIDLGWDVRWSEYEAAVVVGIDMDLDVVDREGRGVFIDDIDEWEEHRVEFGYPAEIVERLEAVAADLEIQVRERRAPFDDATPAGWLARLAELTAPQSER